MIPSFLIKCESDDNIEFYPEDDDGYVEYKLRLDKKTTMGLQKNYSQMNWRLEMGQELLGKKEAHYLLGVKDDGTLGKLTEDDILTTFDIFLNLVNKCNATITQKINKSYKDGNIVYVVISKKYNSHFQELNVAFVGPTQHGKTTTISSLAFGKIDNGNGLTRQLIFKHEHEKQTGQTSSVKKEILGISNGKILNYTCVIKGQWEDLVNVSDKIINIIDVPGDIKYIKTTIIGLQSYDLDAICIVFFKHKQHNTADIDMYINYAKCLSVPYILLNIDDESNDTNDIVENEISMSNVTKININLLEKYLCNIKHKNYYKKDTNLIHTEHTDILFSVIEKFNIPDSGLVLSGVLKLGKIELNQHLLLSNGHESISCFIKSIHKKQIDSQSLFTGETGALLIETTNNTFIENSKYLYITNSLHSKYTQLKFDIFWKSGDYDIFEKSCFSLYIDNNIVFVSVIKYELAELLLKITIPIEIPILTYKTDIVGVLKNNVGVLIGHIKSWM